MQAIQIQIPGGARVRIIELDKDYLFEDEYRPIGNWKRASIDANDIADIFTNPYVEVTVLKARYEDLIIINVPISGATNVYYIIDRYIADIRLYVDSWILEL